MIFQHKSKIAFNLKMSFTIIDNLIYLILNCAVFIQI